MAKARVNLKYLNSTVDLLVQELETLRGKGASRADEKDMAALHKKLTSIKKMMAGECPDNLFRNFELADEGEGGGFGTAAKSRKGSRKVR